MNNTFFRDAPPVKLFFLAAIPGAVSMLASAFTSCWTGYLWAGFWGRPPFLP